MVYYRSAEKYLEQWAASRDRKPLLLRGARQVGKSTLVKKFSSHFEHYFELNLERDRTWVETFDKAADVESFLATLLLRNRISSLEGSTLLFIDEIQVSPRAIWMLRYFYEQRPDLHVIAAGSLLEFSLGDVKSFPVGRVQYYYLHPLTFAEFLAWQGEEGLLAVYQQVPIPEYATEILFEQYNRYLLIGGMPAVVKEFIESGSFGGLPGVYDSIWQSYLQDIEKYAETRKDRDILRFLLQAAPSEGGRITFNRFGGGSFSSREVGTAFRTLELTGVLSLIYPTSQLALPIVADRKKSPKLQLLDTGLLSHALGIQAELISLQDLQTVFNGRLVEHHLTQELAARAVLKDEKPCFWVRQNANASAEVDLVFSHGKYVLPVEIKSGPQGKLRSLHQFIERAPHGMAIRFLRNNYSIEQHVTVGGKPYTLMNLPYFLMGMIEAYAAHLVEVARPD
ncbi:AAA family ATPase [Neolewinella lacunae]|uniref:ATP-binding protein n=1 Tax=Neolewinella lacunae TaxID=1517758 RepID=A0A923PIG0_9BACT|nr:AAA family ATPase [Neolewinella lacunae]MBC6994748.1 ATP-binding protein [Neolewinella lacunae]MDN3634370.1 AAA family ATPase [Neolewinella lacunae]